MSHTHWDGGPTCPHATKSACDKALTDWQAMQTVLLAYSVVRDGYPANRSYYRRGKDVFSQLVRLIAGDQDDIMTGDGNPSQSAEVKRLRAAVERVKASDLPGYNLYGYRRSPAHA